ncbi:MAG: hypothetical protein HN731_10620 [Rhodospirillaceae bacterium]|jgi:hypothetical protein|nr:hypothetical protein [Rhodospirillaceae bacterium]
MLPAFAPWWPHGVAHGLHDQFQSNVAVNSHSDSINIHVHDAHDHNGQNNKSVHHSINLDALKYYSDYLQVDLRKPDQVVFAAPAQEILDIDYDLIASPLQQQSYELASLAIRAPPDWRRLIPRHVPIYLYTQRFRI